MKNDVYGIGNALVDMEFEVEDSFFQSHDIEKGLMTLVDEDRQTRLMSSIDTAVAKKQCGGSAANTIIGLSQFGGKAYYSCKVASDELGDFYMQNLKDSGVDTNLTNGNRQDGLTGKCLVMITPDADRTMNTFLGITSTFSPSELEPEAIKNSKYIYLEGYLITSPTGKAAMIEAKKIAEENGVKVAITLSDPSIVKFFKADFEEVIGSGVDLLFCNEDEALTYTEADNLLAARELLKNIAKNFAVTLGSNGATIFDGDTFIDIESYKVDAVDTNGAGDMFAGAFLYGITHGHSQAQAGKLASLASSKVVSKFGPRLEGNQAKEILEHLIN